MLRLAGAWINAHTQLHAENIYLLHLDVDGPALVHVDGLAALLLPVASDPGAELHVLPRPGVQPGEPLQRGGRRLHPDLPVLALVTPQFV